MAWDTLIIIIAGSFLFVTFYVRSVNNKAYARTGESIEKPINDIPDRVKVEANTFVGKVRSNNRNERLLKLIEVIFLSGSMAEKEYRENIIAQKDAEIAALRQQLAEEKKA